MPSSHNQSSWEKLSDEGFRKHLMGRPVDAERLYCAALQAIKKARNSMAAGAAKLYFHLGDLYSERQDYPKAETFYRHSLAEYEGMEGDHVIDICIALKRISETCRLQSKNRQACNLAGRSQRLMTGKRKLLERSFGQKPGEESA